MCAGCVQLPTVSVLGKTSHTVLGAGLAEVSRLRNTGIPHPHKPTLTSIASQKRITHQTSDLTLRTGEHSSKPVARTTSSTAGRIAIALHTGQLASLADAPVGEVPGQASLALGGRCTREALELASMAGAVIQIVGVTACHTCHGADMAVRTLRHTIYTSVILSQEPLGRTRCTHSWASAS